MLKKMSIFLSFIIALNLSSHQALANDANLSIDTIKQEDEHLLTTSPTHKKVINNEVKYKEPPIPSIVQPNNHPVFPTKKERKASQQEQKEWFKPFSSLQKKTTEKLTDPRFKEFRTQIDLCYKQYEPNLKLEKSLLRNGNIHKNISYLSQTFTSINSCYEDRGLDIISTFYNNDPIMLQSFNNKIKTFYVKGTDASFSGKHCDGKCSLEAIIEEQINKSSEFKTYLLELLSQKERN